MTSQDIFLICMLQTYIYDNENIYVMYVRILISEKFHCPYVCVWPNFSFADRMFFVVALQFMDVFSITPMAVTQCWATGRMGIDESVAGEEWINKNITFYNLTNCDSDEIILNVLVRKRRIWERQFVEAHSRDRIVSYYLPSVVWRSIYIIYFTTHMYIY